MDASRIEAALLGLDTFEFDLWLVNAAGAAGANASLSVTLGDASLAATATNPVSATLAQTLEAASVASGATAPADADLAVTLDDATLSATAGSPAADFAADIALEGAAVAASATAPLDADLAATLGDASLAATATSPIDGDLAVTLDGATVAGAATAPVAATLAKTLGDVGLSATATAPTDADLAATLGDATVAGVARSPVDADLAVTLEDAGLSAAATGQDVAVAELAVTLDDASVAAEANAPVSAALDKTLDAATASGTATAPVDADAAITLGQASVSSTAAAPVHASLDKTLGEATVSAVASRTANAELGATLADATVHAIATAIDVAPPSPVEPFEAARPDSWVEPRRALRRSAPITAGYRTASTALAANRRGATQWSAARDAGEDVVACRFMQEAFAALRKKRRPGPTTPPVKVRRVAQLHQALDSVSLSGAAQVSGGLDPAEFSLGSTLDVSSVSGSFVALDALNAGLGVTLEGVYVQSQAFGTVPPVSEASLAQTLAAASLSATATAPDSGEASLSKTLGPATLSADADVINEATLSKTLGAATVLGILRRPVSAVLSKTLGTAQAAATATSGGRARGSTVLTVDSSFGNGSTNATLHIQGKIDALPADGGTVVVPAGVYMIDTDRLSGGGGLKLRSRMHLQLMPGAVLKAMNNTAPRDYILLIQNVSDVEVSGSGRTVMHLQGDLATATGLFSWPAPAGESTSEWGHGIACYGSQRVTVRDMRIRECVGDGMSIGSAGTADVRIERVDFYNNRRQGLSVVAVVGLLVEDCAFVSTKGTSPECGIDVEPENNPCRNLVFRRIRVATNNKYGFLLLRRTTEQAVIDNVLIEDLISESNVSLGFQARNASNVTIRGQSFIRNNNSEGAWVDNCTNFNASGITFQNNYTKGGTNAPRNFNLVGTDSRTREDWVLRNTTPDTVIGLNYYR